MIKKYIKGNKERSSEVIKALEELGGKNTSNFIETYEDCFYYINADNIITFVTTPAFKSIIQECFEEIKLTERHNVVIKEPKQIYWFRATKDKAKNKVLFDKLCDLVGINKCYMDVSDGIVYFNPLRNSAAFCPEHHLRSSLEYATVMIFGKELVIEQ